MLRVCKVYFSSFLSFVLSIYLGDQLEKLMRQLTMAKSALEGVAVEMGSASRKLA